VVQNAKLPRATGRLSETVTACARSLKLETISGFPTHCSTSRLCSATLRGTFATTTGSAMEVRGLGLALAALSSVSAGYELAHVDERLHVDVANAGLSAACPCEPNIELWPRSFGRDRAAHAHDPRAAKLARAPTLVRAPRRRGPWRTLEQKWRATPRAPNLRPWQHPACRRSPFAVTPS
jgi:hypothetical protein